MNLDHDFFQVSKLSEDQKRKRSSPKMELFFPQIQVKTKKRSSSKFSPNSRAGLRSHAHQGQIIGGDADEDHTQIIGGDAVKLLGGYPPPRVSAPLWPYAAVTFMRTEKLELRICFGNVLHSFFVVSEANESVC